ncbi:ankyrin repeat domain-containing protein [Nocardia sp. NPDC055321]
MGCGSQRPRHRRHTPLHLAAQKDSVDVLRLLLDAGAELEAFSHRGLTPLLIEARGAWSSTETICLLLQCGADPYYIPPDGYSVVRGLRRLSGPQWKIDLLRLPEMARAAHDHDAAGERTGRTLRGIGISGQPSAAVTRCGPGQEPDPAAGERDLNVDYQCRAGIEPPRGGNEDRQSAHGLAYSATE